MKQLVFIVYENIHFSEKILTRLKDAGYNGTVVPSTSLKHTLLNGGDAPMFFHAHHLDIDKFENNTTVYIVCDEQKVDDVKTIVKEETENFKKIKGGIFVIPLISFEGSF